MPCRATFISNGLITPPWGAPSSVGANRPSSITPAFSHWRTSPRAGNVPSDATDVIMVEAVERRRQVGVEHPQTLRVGAARRRVDRHDRVVAATARTEPVGLRLEPGLPLGLQRVHRQGLKAPVGDHGNPERAAAPVALGHIHPLDRAGRPRLGVGAAASRPARPSAPVRTTTLPSTPAVLRPALSSVTRRTATSALLRERSINFCRLRTFFRSPACDAAKIRCRSRRTSSSTWRHSHGVPVERFVLGSVHHARSRPRPFGRRASVVVASNLSLRFRRPRSSCPHRLTRPASAPFRVRASARIRPVMREPLAEEPASSVPGFPLPFGHRHSLLGSSCARRGVQPSSRSAHQTQHSSPGPRRGCHVPHETDTTGVGALCTPGTVVRSRPARSLRAAPAASQRPAPISR